MAYGGRRSSAFPKSVFCVCYSVRQNEDSRPILRIFEIFHPTGRAFSYISSGVTFVQFDGKIKKCERADIEERIGDSVCEISLIPKSQKNVKKANIDSDIHFIQYFDFQRSLLKKGLYGVQSSLSHTGGQFHGAA